MSRQPLLGTSLQLQCEKPMAVSLREADDMLGVGYKMRFYAYNLKAREMVAEGRRASW